MDSLQCGVEDNNSTKDTHSFLDSAEITLTSSKIYQTDPWTCLIDLKEAVWNWADFYKPTDNKDFIIGDFIMEITLY